MRLLHSRGLLNAQMILSQLQSLIVTINLTLFKCVNLVASWNLIEYVKLVSILPYQLLLTIFGKLLSNESVFLLLDVTTLSNTDNHFYPSLINMGVRDSLRRQPLLGTLVPTCCHLYGDDCPSPCFTQKEFYVRHSKKIGDLSKVAYRIVAPKKFIEKFGIAKEEFQYIIKSGAFSDENICRFSTPEAPFVDAYKLNAK